ncbi:hypothetical protein Ancab_026117 [Ancistrocladus abbreviatus]
MGKGGGCFPSKQTTAARTREIEAPIEGDLTTEAATANSHPPPAAKVKVYIVFYSTYGHVESIARTMKKGVESVEGVEGVLYRVPETLSKEILEMLKAKPQDESIPVLTAQELADADGILFGFPTRFGMMPVQMKAFLDTTGGLWKEQKLAGKPAGIFISTSSQGGGQETTAKKKSPSSVADGHHVKHQLWRHPKKPKTPIQRRNSRRRTQFHGHIEGLARRMKTAVDGVDGVEAVLYRVPETLPSEVLEATKGRRRTIRFQ